MKHILIVIGILVIAAMSSGCASKTNTYINEANPADYMELYADNRYVVVSEAGFCGTWRIHNDALYLYFNGAVLYVLQLNGSAYVDPDGDRWVRK